MSRMSSSAFVCRGCPAANAAKGTRQMLRTAANPSELIILLVRFAGKGPPVIVLVSRHHRLPLPLLFHPGAGRPGHLLVEHGVAKKPQGALRHGLDVSHRCEEPELA